jgi:signal transduction histidine kinase
MSRGSLGRASRPGVLSRNDAPARMTNRPSRRISPLTNTSERLAFLGFEEADRLRLAKLAPHLEAKADDFVDAFYQHILSFPETRALLGDEATQARLLAMQREYLLSLAGSVVDECYVDNRRRIGETHERIQMPPRWYLGAYALYLSLLTPLVLEVFSDDIPEAGRTLVALQRLLMFDAQIALEAYIDRRELDLEQLAAELTVSKRDLEDDFDAQGLELTRTTQRAQAAEQLASVGTLVAGLAHEIGTPMGVIQGHAKLLEKAVEGEQAKRRLATIREQIGRISKIIQSLLNMARPRSAQRRPVELETVLETSLSFLTEKLKRHNVELRLDVAPSPYILGDAERLQQLCLNLILNAVDAMPDGGELRVGLRPDEAGGVRLEISDSGVGIRAQDLEQIFDPFFTTKPAGSGNGLGLMVASGIVRDHGGEIVVESNPGSGATFSVSLPARGGPA